MLKHSQRVYRVSKIASSIQKILPPNWEIIKNNLTTLSFIQIINKNIRDVNLHIIIYSNKIVMAEISSHLDSTSKEVQSLIEVDWMHKDIKEWFLYNIELFKI